MTLGIRLHLAGLSLSNTISILDTLGVDRCRSTVHNWVQKAELQPADGADPDHVAVDETVIQLNDARYWLFAAVDADTNRLLHVRLFPTRTQALTEMFLEELRAKHRVDDAVFLIDGVPWLQAACHRHHLRFHHQTHGIATASNVSFERENDEPTSLQTVSATSTQPPPKTGCSRSPSHGISLSEHYHRGEAEGF